MSNYDDEYKDRKFNELHYAVEKNRISAVEVLLQNKMLLNSQTDDEDTSLLLSCTSHWVDPKIAKMLIHAGADVNIPDNVNFTPLLAACETQKVEIVELLLQFGANINHQDENGHTALHYSIENDNLQLVDLLLHSGADTSLTDCNGWNALIMALALNKHESYAERILPFTADLNCVTNSGCADSSGWSALMFAVSNPNVTKYVLYQMIERGAVVNIKVLDNMPVSLALKREDTSIFDYLWDHTDIEILNEELYNIIGAMLLAKWVTPKKIRHFYKVLDTPGVELNCGGYIKLLADTTMIAFNEMEEFLSVDVCGIVKKLFEKGAFLFNLDIEGFILLCYRYNFDYKYKLLQILIDNHANFDQIKYIYLSVWNDPQFTVFLLHFCIIYGPIDVVKCINDAKRLDIPMLKLLKYILRLCTLGPKLRKECFQHLKSFDVSSRCCYPIVFPSPNYPFAKRIKYDLNAEETATLSDLYNQVLELLSKDKVPTLKEMSRDVIRKCILSHFNFCPSTHDYLNSLKLLHLPQFMTDIIQCKSAVSSIE